MDNMDNEITNYAEAAASLTKAANDRLAVETGKYAKAKNLPADKFSANAASPQWVGGFDQLPGSGKRTTS